MINCLIRYAQEQPHQPLFYVRASNGTTGVFSYAHARLAVALIAQELERRGLGAGSVFACNLYNGPEAVLLSLAAAYGGATLALLNPRFSAAEQELRLAELNAAINAPAVEVFDAPAVQRLCIDATGFSIASFAGIPYQSNTFRALEENCYDYRQVREGAYVSAAVDAAMAAAPASITSPLTKQGIVMFTSGSSGTPKAAFLPWYCVSQAALAANDALAYEGRGVWQMVLPLCHIGGFQIMVRSILNGSTFIVYERFQPDVILNDVLSLHATHISVVDKILADLLEADKDRIMNQYACVLLGGSALNEKTVRTAMRAKVNMYASYGMTETASLIAAAPVRRGFKGHLHVLEGYQVRIASPDEKGIGQLQVTGPGIFDGYLNARKATTPDGYFVTGDRARIGRDGLLELFERTDDLIISGGENIYPEEIRRVLLNIPGVNDAYVFGTADESWGYRPVAFVEADYSAPRIAHDCEMLGLTQSDVGIHAATCPQEFARMLHDYLEERMSHLQHPKHILVMGEFPRTVVGKVDYQALKQAYDKRIDIKSVRLIRTEQPFVQPVHTPKATLTVRASFFVEVTDWAGRTGIAECVSFPTAWYMPETLGEDWVVVRESIASIITTERYLRPSEVSASLATFPALNGHPMAKAAVEPAIWDLYGKIVGKPLYELIGGQANVDSAGVSTAGGVAGAGVAGADTSGIAGVVGAGASGIAGVPSAVGTVGVPGSEKDGAGGVGAMAARTVGTDGRGGSVVGPATVAAGAVVGLGTPSEVLACVDALVEQGYIRVKLKIEPRTAVSCVRAVREAHPNLTLVLDANQSFNETQLDILCALDTFSPYCIEEPYDPAYTPASGVVGLFARLSSLQEHLHTMVALDESLSGIRSVEAAMRYDNLRCYVLKVAKFGGIQPTLDVYRWLMAQGKVAWMGGMFETGVSKRLHAAFCTLPGVQAPGDISSYSEYFAHDCALPALEARDGHVAVNTPEQPVGLGCVLDKEYLRSITVDSVVVRG